MSTKWLFVLTWCQWWRTRRQEEDSTQPGRRIPRKQLCIKRKEILFATSYLGHAVVAHPTARSIAPHVANYFSVHALRCGGGVAGGRTDGSLSYCIKILWSLQIDIFTSGIQKSPIQQSAYDPLSQLCRKEVFIIFIEYLNLPDFPFSTFRGHRRIAFGSLAKRLSDEDGENQKSFHHWIIWENLDWLSLLASWFKYTLITVHKCVGRPNTIKKLLLFYCPVWD